MFDEQGCVRAPCGPDGCGAGEFCYRPSDYGGCVSSSISCDESEDGVCSCGFLSDCGGEYCVPESVVFGGIVPGPTVGIATETCLPDGESGFSVSVGEYMSNACGGSFGGGPRLTISVAAPLGTEASFATEQSVWLDAQYTVDGVTDAAAWVVLRVDDVGAVLSGEYEVLLPDERLLVGTFGGVVVCPSERPLSCG